MEEHIGVSEVAEYYRNKTVFVTGGTGFLGKVLVEKLLRSCNIRKIYVLVRPKRGADIQERLDEMLSFKLFDGLKETQPEVLQRIFPVKGDITVEGLGLSEEDEARLGEEVHLIFHVAATINFQEPLRVAVSMNILGTKRVVSLAHKMKNIECIVHVSTAYGNCHLPEIDEELYPAPIDPGRLIQLTEWLDDDILDPLTPKLLKGRPNTYTYTKALAEHLLINDAGPIPIVIIRPSIVCGAWREPLPGWVDNMFAFTGLLVGMGKGVLRSLWVKPGIKLDFVPVDITINLMLVAAWNVSSQKYRHTSTVPIYSCSSSAEKPLTIERLEYLLKNSARKIPLDSPLWYPDGNSKNSKFLHNLHVMVANIIPAHIADFGLKILGRKPIKMEPNLEMEKCLRVVYSPWMPFVNDDATAGIYVEVLKILQQKMKFCFTTFPQPDFRWGAKMDNGSFDGMIGALTRKEMDMAIGPFGIVYDRFQVIFYSEPVLPTDYAIVYSRPVPEPDILGFIKPFSWETWLLLLVSLIVFTPLIFAIQWMTTHLRGRKEDEGQIDTNGVEDAEKTHFIWAFALLFGQSMQSFPRGWTVQTVISLWLFLTFIFANVYKSTLTAMLLLPKAKPPNITRRACPPKNQPSASTDKGLLIDDIVKECNISSKEVTFRNLVQDNPACVAKLLKISIPFDSVEEMVVQDGYRWAFPESSLSYAAFKAAYEDNPSSTFGQVFAKKERMMLGDKEHAPYVLSGKSALITARFAALSMVATDFSEQGYCRTSIARRGILPVSFSYTFQWNSTLKAPMDKIIFRLKEFGIVKKLGEIPNSTQCMGLPGRENQQQTRPLLIRDFLGIFLIYGIGMFIAVLAFLGELLHHHIVSEM